MLPGYPSSAIAEEDASMEGDVTTPWLGAATCLKKTFHSILSLGENSHNLPGPAVLQAAEHMHNTQAASLDTSLIACVDAQESQVSFGKTLAAHEVTHCVVNIVALLGGLHCVLQYFTALLVGLQCTLLGGFG